MDAKQLAKILFEEFEQDGWGDINPYLFKQVASGEYTTPEDGGPTRDEGGMEEVLTRAAAKITKFCGRR